MFCTSATNSGVWSKNEHSMRIRGSAQNLTGFLQLVSLFLSQSTIWNDRLTRKYFLHKSFSVHLLVGGIFKCSGSKFESSHRSKDTSLIPSSRSLEIFAVGGTKILIGSSSKITLATSTFKTRFFSSQVPQTICKAQRTERFERCFSC
jgi:hypothetical protein